MILVLRLFCRLLGHRYCECHLAGDRRCLRCGRREGGPGFKEIDVPFPLKRKIVHSRRSRR